MSKVLLTKRLEFAAAHRYIKPEWDEAKNRAVFGLCYNPPAHGHNYMIEVTVLGEVDPKTGMVVNLFDLKLALLKVLEEFDHKNLNLDMPYFKDQIPTSENLARVLWSKLDGQKDIGKLHAIRLYEDEDLYAEVTAEAGLDVASVTRRYSFTALSNSNHGCEWDCFVTVHGDDRSGDGDGDGYRRTGSLGAGEGRQGVRSPGSAPCLRCRVCHGRATRRTDMDIARIRPLIGSSGQRSPSPISRSHVRLCRLMFVLLDRCV